MVTVIVRDDQIGHVREIDAEFDGVAEHSLRALAGIDQHSSAIHFKQRRKSPLADATTGITRQHRGENRHFDRFGRFSRGKEWEPAGHDGERNDRQSNTKLSHGKTPLLHFNLDSPT